MIPVIDAVNRTVDDVDDLFAAMRTRDGYVAIVKPDGITDMGHISSVEREDGSGWKFNVHVYMRGDKPGVEHFFVEDLSTKPPIPDPPKRRNRRLGN